MPNRRPKREGAANEFKRARKNRLTELDLPIQRIAAHARPEKSIGPETIAAVKALLADACKQLHVIIEDEFMMAETPMEVQTAIECAAEAVDAALRRLDLIPSQDTPSAPIPGGPTRQQGQFLAFIREYMMRNEAGVAPSHADLQRFFNLTPPSVNSMLIRLEQRGFIRRVPGKARAIEIRINPEWIPPLDRPFRF
jgi:hypothetical protein